MNDIKQVTEDTIPSPDPPKTLEPQQGRFKKTRRFALLACLTSGLFGILLFLYAYFFEPRMIQVTRYEIRSPQLPKAFDKKKIVFISDIHHGSQGSTDLRKQLVTLTKNESPDLLFFGGDYSVDWDKQRLRECFEVFSEMTPPLGKYGVLGNHDYWKPSLVQQEMQRSGIQTLLNDTLSIEHQGERIRLVGVRDLWEDKPSLLVMQGFLPNDFVILLSHNPDYVEKITQQERDQIDLVLSGHSHGGQITLFGLYAPVQTTLPKYITGLVKPTPNCRTSVIVSNGIGTTSLPLRFFAAPQLVVVTLVSEQEHS